MGVILQNGMFGVGGGGGGLRGLNDKPSEM